MSKLVAIVAVAVGLVLALSSVALAHPSENRDPQSTFGGPHCHVNLESGHLAFPSHRAHIATGLSDGVFAGAPCPD